MTKTGYVLANLFRRKTRTILTLLSVVIAFMLFGLLQAVGQVFNAGTDFLGATRLVTQARVSFMSSLPMRMMPEIEAVPGVEHVMQQQWFGGVWQENTPLFALAVDPVRLHQVYPEWVMPEDQWRAFANTRTGMIAGRTLIQQYGWKIGQKVPIGSNIFPQKNGSMKWAFDLVGIYDGKDEQWQAATTQVYINHAYFDEANQFARGAAGIYVMKLSNADVAAQVARTIDTRYENSPDETKTQSEKDFNIGFATQVADIGLIVTWILFAVFFTLLLVVGNTMAQSVRERVPELAILKTLGFSDGTVLTFVLAEALALCALGGLVGMTLATLAGFAISKNAGATFLPVNVDWKVWGLGVAAIGLMSFCVGVLPALRAQRLNIVDALADR